MCGMPLLLVAAVAVGLTVGCTTTVQTGYNNREGSSGDKYQDPMQPTGLQTLGMESNDIHSAVSKVVGRLLANPLLSGQERAPHIILDSRYFVNETSERINKKMIVDLLRSELLNAANGRVIVISREHTMMVENEGDLQDEGIVGPGTTPGATRPLGGDYRLGGRITELTRSDASTGQIQRYTQILFEVSDLETNQLVLSETYYYKKSASDASVYK